MVFRGSVYFTFSTGIRGVPEKRQHDMRPHEATTTPVKTDATLSSEHDSTSRILDTCTTLYGT